MASLVNDICTDQSPLSLTVFAASRIMGVARGYSGCTCAPRVTNKNFGGII